MKNTSAQEDIHAWLYAYRKIFVDAGIELLDDVIAQTQDALHDQQRAGDLPFETCPDCDRPVTTIYDPIVWAGPPHTRAHCAECNLWI